MLRLRRTEHNSRIEIMPLIDVIFLLLTFFIYAMVLMVRAELVPMEIRELASAEPATPAPAVTISIDQHGDIFIDRDPIALDDVLPRLREAIEENPDTAIYLAADERGTSDRLPTFLDLYDRVANAGLNIKLVGSPKSTAPLPE